MDVRFNYTRCSNQSELLIYSYSIPSPPVRYFTLLNTTAYHTHDPDKACLFFVFLDSPHKVLPETLPYWGHNGLNHVLVTFADMWHHRVPDPERMGFASIFASDMHETIYRPGFDISITLPGHVHIDSLQSIPPLEREYLATFRGLRYLGAPNEEGSLRSYDSFRSIHNGKDVIVVTTCKHHTNDLKRQADPQLGRHCEEDEAEYARYSFGGLMNTTFGLVPAGRQPNSYRLVEVMAAGVVPVLIADNYVKPFDTIIQWHQCLLQFPSSQMHLILPTLRAMVARARDDQGELLQRQRSCIHIYNHFLRDDPTLLRAAIASLKARFYGAMPFKPSVVNND
jgi:glucuronyl/N-acetylglucosaminyl transferase EXT1